MRGRRIWRGAACFMAALVLMTLALCMAVYLSATDAGLFERGVLSNVNLAGLQISEADARRFAAETIAYLRGETDAWAPVVVAGGKPLEISEDFTAHMATVRGRTNAAVWLLPAGLAAGLALIAGALIFGGGSRKGSYPLTGAGEQSSPLQRGGARKSPFPTVCWYAGTLLPLAALCGLMLWARIDFSGMWAWLHVSFIPDGIFDAAEPIMSMFPASLFADYLKPVGISFGVMAAIVLALPIALKPLAYRIDRRRG